MVTIKWKCLEHTTHSTVIDFLKRPTSISLIVHLKMDTPSRTTLVCVSVAIIDLLTF